MIGIKTKNKLLAQTLCQLYPDQICLFQENGKYVALIVDEIQENQTIPCLYLGDFEQFPFSLKHPFSFKEFEEKIAKLQNHPYKLKHFLWHSPSRQLKEKNSEKCFLLTQKEAELIDFLISCPKHQATKEDLLNHVWHYHETSQTHTLETHIYALRQKLGSENSKLFTNKKGMYCLL